MRRSIRRRVASGPGSFTTWRSDRRGSWVTRSFQIAIARPVPAAGLRTAAVRPRSRSKVLREYAPRSASATLGAGLAPEVVDEVDGIRLAWLRKQLRRMGFRGADLEARTRLFLHSLMADAEVSAAAATSEKKIAQ